MEFRPLLVHDKSIPVKIITGNFNGMRAAFRNGTIVLKVPLSLDRNSMYIKSLSLLEEIEARMNKAPATDLRPKLKRLSFHNGQEVIAMGERFKIRVNERNDIRSTAEALLLGDVIGITLPAPPEKRDRETYDKCLSSLARRIIAGKLKNKLRDRVTAVNDKYFNSAIGKVLIRDTSGKWGSCQNSTNNLSFSFKLLFMPDDVLDSVIVHELAHTKIKGHSKEFWDLVYSVMPNYKEKKAWLNKSSDDFLRQAGFD